MTVNTMQHGTKSIDQSQFSFFKWMEWYWIKLEHIFLYSYVWVFNFSPFSFSSVSLSDSLFSSVTTWKRMNWKRGHWGECKQQSEETEDTWYLLSFQPLPHRNTSFNFRKNVTLLVKLSEHVQQDWFLRTYEAILIKLQSNFYQWSEAWVETVSICNNNHINDTYKKNAY